MTGGEAHNFRYHDVDFERNTINIKPEKMKLTMHNKDTKQICQYVAGD
jgi:hypothetical protein